MTTAELYEAFKSSTGVSTDTRSIQKNNLYFALKGENFDGNRFADQALQTGASYAVIDDANYATDHTILIDDVLKSLQDLARVHRKQLTIPIIGLTGSNGKTTTKELMAAVLSKKYKTAFTKGNLNNHIGVPLTVLSVTEEHQMAIIEMGANHQKEIEFLCSISRPDYGYITNFGKAHLEGFGGVEGVIKGKSELFDFLRENGGKAFVNSDDQKQISQSAGLEQITFGESKNAQQQVKIVEKPRTETVVVAFANHTAVTRLTGRYNFSNIAAAITVGKHFGVPDEDIKNAIESYLPQNNRSQISQTERNKLVIDTYNANPSSTEAALQNFTAFDDDHKWVILGDMFELGEYTKEEHQKVAELAMRQNFEKIILVGKDYTALELEKQPELVQLSTTDELLELLQQQRPTGKTILLKGSRGMKLERAIPLL